jgi:periplasmic protein TonB
MKTLLVSLVLLLVGSKNDALKDTTVYLSASGKVLVSEQNAVFCDKLTTQSPKKYVLTKKQLVNQRWKDYASQIIEIKNDSTYIVTKVVDKIREKSVRVTKANSKGFFSIRDYKENKLIAQGLSKSIFPEIKEGLWIVYHPNGQKASEQYFQNNQMTGNRNWNEKGVETESNVFPYAQEMPEFPGGVKQMNQFIKENAHPSSEAIRPAKHAIVYVQMVVFEDGSLNKITVAKGVHALLDAEALRVVSLMPKWVPGQINGQKVKVLVTIPVVFNLLK